MYATTFAENDLIFLGSVEKTLLATERVCTQEGQTRACTQEFSLLKHLNVFYLALFASLQYKYVEAGLSVSKRFAR